MVNAINSVSRVDHSSLPLNLFEDKHDGCILDNPRRHAAIARASRKYSHEVTPAPKLLTLKCEEFAHLGA
ncbi:unnamed protein product [Clonostachys byssicola]|uniref:Uncharacterized protein n=1 Tax=Clonostachys byssicola TaxID=160290 RepID=A0A9N9UA94_9HYPO|nr:unnamed protein product [Clonostachys byssicola]